MVASGPRKRATLPYVVGESGDDGETPENTPESDVHADSGEGDEESREHARERTPSVSAVRGRYAFIYPRDADDEVSSTG